ncbi:hypothetical protein MUP32_06355 [Candidatus Microgenomates bacterium]|nr:hypothetical protein [Candidatus Microgenomates bacterium]
MPPWKSYKGIICDLNGCHTSEIQQQNEYWIDQAIIKKDVALCNNSLGFGFQNKAKEQSVYECKSEYAVGIGDLEYCSSLDKEVQYVNCRQKYAIKYRKPEICEGISTSGDENDRLSIIKACKKEAVK